MQVHNYIDHLNNVPGKQVLQLYVNHLAFRSLVFYTYRKSIKRSIETATADRLASDGPMFQIPTDQRAENIIRPLTCKQCSLFYTLLCTPALGRTGGSRMFYWGAQAVASGQFLDFWAKALFIFCDTHVIICSILNSNASEACAKFHDFNRYFNRYVVTWILHSRYYKDPVQFNISQKQKFSQ